MGRGGTLGRGSIASVGKPSSSTLASLAGLLSAGDSGTKAESSFSQTVCKREDKETDPTESSLTVDKEPVFQRVRVSLQTVLFRRYQHLCSGNVLNLSCLSGHHKSLWKQHTDSKLLTQNS